VGVGKRTRRQNHQPQDRCLASLAEAGQQLEVVGACILQAARADVDPKGNRRAGMLPGAERDQQGGYAHDRRRSQVPRRSHRRHHCAPQLGLDNDPEPSLMMPGIIISLIFSEQGKLVLRATPLQY